ncbi:MAG: hypothetical protein ACI4EF_00025 [Coprococcus sp.]
MSDNHDLLNDNDMCSFSGHEAEDMCFNCGDHTCGVRSSAVTSVGEVRADYGGPYDSCPRLTSTKCEGRAETANR